MRVNGIDLHHSASSRDQTKVADIRRWHVDQNKWSDIGYHYVIEGDGALRVGRPAHLVGAHVLGYNANYLRGTYRLGICLTGNFENERPNAAQIKTLVQLLAILCRRHGLNEQAIQGHRDHMATKCPGYYLYREFRDITTAVSLYLAT